MGYRGGERGTGEERGGYRGGERGIGEEGGGETHILYSTGT